MRTALILILGLTATLAHPTNLARPSEPRIVGGDVTTIEAYPFAVALLASSSGLWYSQSCGGAILNNRSVLTAAHCFMSLSQLWNWRSRVGSTFASSGGTVFDSQAFIHHPNFNRNTLDMDFTILRISGTFTFGNSIRAASIAGANYNLADNQVVWAVGWGTTCSGCSLSEQLRHVQIWTVNQNTCVSRYNEMRWTVTENMLCSGWLDVGGRDQCQGDSGGPLLHNNVVVGVCSWGNQCALARFPGVNARVSSASTWIVANA